MISPIRKEREIEARRGRRNASSRKYFGSRERVGVLEGKKGFKNLVIGSFEHNPSPDRVLQRASNAASDDTN